MLGMDLILTRKHWAGDCSLGEVMRHTLTVTGGTKRDRDVAEKAIRWALSGPILISTTPDLSIKVKICQYVTHQCWGSVVEDNEENTAFSMTIANNQGLRDYIATIMHEMIHVNQYVTQKWDGDGEREAEYWQYKMADMFWTNGEL